MGSHSCTHLGMISQLFGSPLVRELSTLDSELCGSTYMNELSTELSQNSSQSWRKGEEGDVI